MSISYAMTLRWMAYIKIKKIQFNKNALNILLEKSSISMKAQKAKYETMIMFYFTIWSPD